MWNKQHIEETYTYEEAVKWMLLSMYDAECMRRAVGKSET